MLLARLLTRPDVVDAELPAFLAWCPEALARRNAILTAGVLSTLAAVIKHAPRRTDVLPHAAALAALANAPDVRVVLASHSLVRVQHTKVRGGRCRNGLRSPPTFPPHPTPPHAHTSVRRAQTHTSVPMAKRHVREAHRVSVRRACSSSPCAACPADRAAVPAATAADVAL